MKKLREYLNGWKKNTVELKEFLNNVAVKITGSFVVDEIILFGSYAKGTETDESDIDVAVISPELNVSYPMFKNAMNIIRKADLYEPYLQLVPFNSQKFYEESSIDPNFVKEIKKTGKQIYSKESGIDLKWLTI